MEELDQVHRSRKHFSVFEKQYILRQHVEKGLPLAALARKYGISRFSLYRWQKWIDLTLDPEMPHGKLEEILAELEKLKAENKSLKKAVEDLAVERSCQKEVLEELKKRASQKQSLLRSQSRSKKSSR